MRLRWLRTLRAFAGAAALSVLIAAPLLAHHGAADYEKERTITIKGTVVDYQLINPHTMIVIHGGPEGSEPADWRIESVALNMMVRVGWKQNSLKPGDLVTVTGRPNKAGKPAMLLVKLILPDGRELDAPYQ